MVPGPQGGIWRMVAYQSKVDSVEHVALVKGDISGEEPVLVRMHAVDLLDDMTGGTHWISIHNAMHMIGGVGRGVLVLIREHRPTALAERVSKLGVPPVASAAAGGGGSQNELRDYGIGAQILLDLGVKDMVLLSNTRRTLIGLDGYGLNIVGQRAIPNIIAEGYTG
jgi:3,4-dihydroxy 2-butanone 4-phosphate synthase / GTP cyclohydrolase II